MSVSIIAESPVSYNDVFFYAGTFFTDGDMISHAISQASDLKKIGSTLKRKASLDGNILTLSGTNTTGTLYYVTWERL